jgi:hypothetical protein
MLKPLFRQMSPASVSHKDIMAALTPQWLPGRRSWLQALFLLPLAIPGIRLILSGLSWFEWLRFPGGWLVASIVFILIHLILPVIIIGVAYRFAQSFWRVRNPASSCRIRWLACSTVAIMILSFLGTASATTLLEIVSCQLLPAVKLTTTCSNYFPPTNLQNWLLNYETYDFGYYHWLVWLIITAFLCKWREKIRPGKTKRRKLVRKSLTSSPSHLPLSDNLEIPPTSGLVSEETI